MGATTGLDQSGASRIAAYAARIHTAGSILRSPPPRAGRNRHAGDPTHALLNG
jgi:hypothetical protein